MLQQEVGDGQTGNGGWEEDGRSWRKRSDAEEELNEEVDMKMSADRSETDVQT